MSFRSALQGIVGSDRVLTTQDLARAAREFDRDGDPTTVTAAEVDAYLAAHRVSEYHPLDGDRRDVRELFGLTPGSGAKHTPQELMEHALSPAAARPRGLLTRNAGIKIRRLPRGCSPIRTSPFHRFVRRMAPHCCEDCDT